VVPEAALPGAGAQTIGPHVVHGRTRRPDEQLDDLLEAPAQDGEWNTVRRAPAREGREARVDGDVGTQARGRLGEGHPDGAEVARDRLAQAERAIAQEPARLAVVLGAGPEPLGQEPERVGLRDGAVEVAEDVQHQRGKASGTPPSTGSVAPVVGVRLEAKNTTALPTCSAVTAALSRLRSR